MRHDGLCFACEFSRLYAFIGMVQALIELVLIADRGLYPYLIFLATLTTKERRKKSFVGYREACEYLRGVSDA